MQMLFRTHIDNTAKEQVFDLIANIKHYDTWLPGSKSFWGIRHISDDPIKQGTTYTDGQGRLEMHGLVRMYDPPEQIIFHQVAKFRVLGILSAELGVTVDYILVQEHSGTTVIRNVEVEVKGILKLVRARIMSQIKTENERLLQVMKQVLEKTF